MSGIGDALDLSFSFRSGRLSIVPVQIRSEIEGLLDLLAAEPPRTVLEIGTWNGGTLYLFARVAAPDAFHDIVPGAPEGVGEVPRFWQELKREHDVVELVASWDQAGSASASFECRARAPELYCVREAV